MSSAAARWQAALEAWALPPEILNAAPEDPYGLPAGVRPAGQEWPPEHPTRRPIDAHLPDGGILLDVGCGPGVLACAYREQAHVVGVEPAAGPAAEARRTGIEVIEERWPQAATHVPIADVVVCTHVLYDVPELAPFVTALTSHARGAVVVEITDRHPWVGLGPLYQRFHGLDRPTGPTADDAAAVVTESIGTATAVERWERPGNLYPDLDMLVAHRRRQLCLPADADADIAEAIADTYDLAEDGSVRTRPGPVVTLRWEGRATADPVNASNGDGS